MPENIIEVGFDDGVIVESFEEQGRWTVFTDTTRAGALPDDARLSQEVARDGDYGMRYRWNRDVRSGLPRGIRLTGPDDPVPVVVSRDFLSEASLDEGQTVLLSMASIYVPVQIVGTFDLFPTWDPEDARSLIIANRDYLYYRVNRNPATIGAAAPNEVWIQPTDADGLRQLRTFLEVTPPWKHEAYDVDAIRNLQDEDPLVAAGWEGLLFLTFIAIVLLAALGFLVASVLVAQQQQGRVRGAADDGLLVASGAAGGGDREDPDYRRVDGAGHGRRAAVGHDDAGVRRLRRDRRDGSCRRS